ncbi:hypothetical protein [Paenibacillus harenae]|uniref:Peptidoglycan hydrolase CwlO-like protein n=1 Tax=Paenibacillus harenae TaxID=306543 RepID=A0ABT9U7N1_PAEHA|nr:hypothetical protein [Paenibacillus harenae]MDQ0115013.1 peptidoglycan hydrolase CwlO-like protein [Paenibacillus harenae]
MNDIALDSRTGVSTDMTRRKKRNGRALILFACLWLVLISSGIYGAKWYTDRIQQNISASLERQTASQITAMQQTYEARMKELETNYTADIADLGAKVDALNELLTFTKDNADSKTDNSNKLYTQLNEVKKQLNELQKSLEVLK